MQAPQRYSNVLKPKQPQYHTSSAEERVTALYMGNRYSGDGEDDVLDDPPWYNAPRGSLQPALPESLLKMQSNPSIEGDTASSEDPLSPSSIASDGILGGFGDEEDHAEEAQDIAPLPVEPPKKKKQIPVHMKSSSQKHQIKRLSLSSSPQKHGRGSLSSPDQPATSPRSTDLYQRGSMSFDMRGSLDIGSAMGVPTGGRESMMAYRPSDLNAHELKHTLMTRDSLAPDMNDYGRGSMMAGRPSEDGLSDFLKAAKTGNLMLFKACLQDRTTDVTQRDPVHGQTALHLAVRGGQFTIVRLLCQKKYRKLLIDSVDNRQNTPLHLAAAKSRRITKFLLEQGGASVDKVNARNQTPLGVHILTTRRDDPLIAEMLLQFKSDPNATLDQSTLIHKAIELQLYEIACRLVRYGARLDVKDENHKMVFDKVNRKVLRQLLSKISYPPVWVPDEERDACMVCCRKFNKFRIGIRRHHCRHCGRVCCGQCSQLSIESVLFPKTFDDRMKKGSATRNHSKKRVCKTCNIVFRDRHRPQEEKKAASAFVQKIMGCSWEEVPGQQNAPRASIY